MDDAKKVLSDASKKNGKYVPASEIELTKPSAAAAKGGFIDIMKHPTLRIHVMIMYFNWFTTAFIMYGLALSWQNLTGGLFLNFIIGTILDFPAKTLAMLLVQNVGRKYPYLCGSTITGVMFLLTLFIPRDVYPSNWPIVVLALIGNFSTTMCFAILYMYTGIFSYINTLIKFCYPQVNLCLPLSEQLESDHPLLYQRLAELCPLV